MNFTQIEDIITMDGWVRIRVLGSNCQYKKSGCETTVIIPGRNNENIPMAMIHNLEKITGLSLRR